MNNTSLKLAAAIALALGGVAAQSATITVAAAGKYSAEAAARNAAVSATSVNTGAQPDVVMATAAAYLSGDVITLTLGGTSGANFAVTTPGAGFGTLTCGAAAQTATSGTATTRVFTVPVAGVAATTNCTFSGATYTNASLTKPAAANGTITLSGTVARSGSSTSVDSASAVTVSTVENELSVTVTNALNGVVDFITASAAGGLNGKIFASASNPVAGAADNGAITGVDTLRLTLNKQAVTGDSVTLDASNALRITLGGDFNFLNNTSTAGVADGCANPGTDTGNRLRVLTNDTGAAVAIGTILSASCSEIVIQLSGPDVTAILADVAVAGGAPAKSFDIQFDVGTAATASVLSARTFTASPVWTYTASASAVTTTKTETITAGSWTANGSTVFIPYMPVGANISQTVWVANNSGVAGTASITARDQNGVACSTAFGSTTLLANRVTSLGDAIARGLAACYGGANTTNKLFLTITASIPDYALEVYSAYNVNGNRVNVVNSSNGKSTGDDALGGGNSTR